MKQFKQIEKNSNMKDLYEKLVQGDHLTNPELESMYEHFRSCSNMLFELGPTFRLSAIELNNRADQVFGYIRQRMNADSKQVS